MAFERAKERNQFNCKNNWVDKTWTENVNSISQTYEKVRNVFSISFLNL